MKKENCQIHRATVEDADILSELGKRTYLQHFSSIWGVDKLQRLLVERFATDTLTQQLADTQHTGFLIASIAERPVGFAKINWAVPDPAVGRPGAELQKLYVDAKLTGRGIGERLLKSALLLAREQPEDVLWLQVLDENDAAQRFYRRHGFITIGQVPFNTDVIQTAMNVMIFNLAVVAATPVVAAVSG